MISLDNASKQLDTVRKVLDAARGTLAGSSSSAALDAELLLAVALGQSRAWLYGHAEDQVDAQALALFRTLLAQRAQGVPVAHLTGVREFWSLEFEVSEHTLVPRPETELLVEQTLLRVPSEAAARVLDLGTGTGALAIALATERLAAAIIATDNSAEALQVAQANAARHCPERIRFHTGDWFAALPSGTPAFDVIVSNPPYVGTGETELTDAELAFEPAQALYSGKDGLDDLRRIIAGTAGGPLRPGGWLLLEHGSTQADAVSRMLTAAGFDSIHTYADIAGLPRVTEARLPDE